MDGWGWPAIESTNNVEMSCREYIFYQRAPLLLFPLAILIELSPPPPSPSLQSQQQLKTRSVVRSLVRYRFITLFIVIVNDKGDKRAADDDWVVWLWPVAVGRSSIVCVSNRFSIWWSWDNFRRRVVNDDQSESESGTEYHIPISWPQYNYQGRGR